MQSISAKELKNRTGEVLRRVGGGEKVLMTKRGKPCAVLSPVSEEEIPAAGLRPYAGQLRHQLERRVGNK